MPDLLNTVDQLPFVPKCQVPLPVDKLRHVIAVVFFLTDLEDDNTLWDNNSLSDDLMFNVAYSWCNYNIYHHDDPFDDFGMNSIDIVSEPFNTEISDSFSTVHNFDD